VSVAKEGAYDEGAAEGSYDEGTVKGFEVGSGVGRLLGAGVGSLEARGQSTAPHARAVISSVVA
jgi:hypothetical protein